MKIKFSPALLKKILSGLLIIGIFYNIGSVLWQQRDKYLSHTYWKNFRSLEQKYLDSQYINKHPKAWLRDEVVFSYAGGKLIKGTNPVLIIPDAPPLGKYMIGVSVLIFNNENIIIAIFGITSLILLYLLSRQIIKDKFLAIIPVFLYSSEPMFKNQFIYTPLMDLFQLVFIILFFLFINKGVVAKKKIIIFFMLANVFLGCFISTKFFVSGATVVASTLLWTIIHRDLKRAILYLVTLPISIAILLLSYARVLSFGYSFRELLGIQKWVFLYHKSNLILPFSVWPLLFINRWYVWFGDKPYISDGQWSITWPIITTLSFIVTGLYIFKKIKINKEIEIPMIWSVCYLVFFSFGQIFSRYFIILLPIFYIISIYGINNIIERFFIKIDKKSRQCF